VQMGGSNAPQPSPPILFLENPDRTGSSPSLGIKRKEKL
jgi:hypothetical protein